MPEFLEIFCKIQEFTGCEFTRADRNYDLVHFIDRPWEETLQFENDDAWDVVSSFHSL